MLKREEVSDLWVFYFYKFMRGLFFLTTITLFIFYSEKGLSFFQASIAIAFSSLMQVIFEFITGSIADTFGRKLSVVLSLFLDAIIIFLIAMSDSFWQFFVLLGLWGVSSTLASGADTAWAVDSLIEKKKEHLLDSYYAKSRSFFNAGMILAGVASSTILAYSNHETLWFLRSGLTFLLAVVVLVFGRERFPKKRLVFRETIRATVGTAKEAVNAVRRSNVLLKMAIASFFVFTAIYLAESSAIQHYKLQSVPVEYWGYILIFTTILGVFLPHYSIKLSNRFSNGKNFLSVAFLVLAVLYFAAPLSFNPFYVVGLVLLYSIAEDLYSPSEERLYNKYTPSKNRASVLSLKSMIENAGLLIGITIAGYLTDTMGGAYTIAVSGFVLLPAVLFYYFIKEKE